MISSDSKYDRYLSGSAMLSDDEEAGRNVFFSERGDCYHCHLNPVLTDNALHNTGLDSIYAKNADRGFYNVSMRKEDLGKFKTPSLRNVALRKRFMHDGRFGTLEEVIEFYNSGVRKVDNLDPIMTKPGKEYGLRLGPIEKHQLLAFLQTFTDSTFISNPDLSRP
jgi:cytochrome c peroxidase